MADVRTSPELASPLIEAVARGLLPFVLVGLGLAIVIAALWTRRTNEAPSVTAGVRAKSFMTPPERKMADLLERALPGHRVHAQVSMGALLDARPELKGSDRMRVRGRFTQKIVDFTIEHRGTGGIIALVELDDRTHVPARDQQRDVMTIEAGYRTVRFHRDAWPSLEQVRSQILPEQNERQGGHVAG